VDFGGLEGRGTQLWGQGTKDGLWPFLFGVSFCKWLEVCFSFRGSLFMLGVFSKGGGSLRFPFCYGNVTAVPLCCFSVLQEGLVNRREFPGGKWSYSFFEQASFFGFGL